MKAALQRRPVYNFLIALQMLCAVEGLLCPLDDNEAVSLCAMCSYNEAAVKWTKSDVEFNYFVLTYNCTSESNSEDQSISSHDQPPSNNNNPCPWYGWRDIFEGTSRIYSIGRELHHGTVCVFELLYQKRGENFDTISSSCSVNETCETGSCSIDRVCAFNNETQGAVCTECSCTEGYTGQSCDNIDECATSNECSDHANCNDSDGSYWCECWSGFQGDGYNCTDINECETVNETCSNVNAECVNSVGSYSCQCKQGYTGDGDNCTDFDECATSNECSDHANCHDTDGSYWCECWSGFQGDGYNCTDINECVNETCSNVNAECVNSVGSYSCQCKQGYTGDGDNCTNIDECTTNNECSDHANCNDTDGSYWCECWSGFQGDGYNCTDSRTDGIITANLVTVITVMTVLVILMVVSVIVIVIICIRRLRFNGIDFKIYDTLAVKEIDPFYSPTFITGSLKSIHSEYECLYTISDNDETKSIKESLLADDDIPVIDQIIPTTSDPLQNLVDCEQASIDSPNTSSNNDLSEQENSLLPSDSTSENDYTMSKPYIDDKSVLEIWKESQRIVDVETSKAIDFDETLNSEESAVTSESPLLSPTDSTLLSVVPHGYVTLGISYQGSDNANGLETLIVEENLKCDSTIDDYIMSIAQDEKTEPTQKIDVSDYIEYTGLVVPVCTGD